ncbi:MULTISPECIES: nicotianamine synthase family protein [unclassified Colwellia]|uniref:nicotianamine synthase family protein n=1 Tax=unclassified Colwellia TaxID=196834 RepID=UPI0015F43A78|nr:MULTISPECIES: nicotianamine synthase family protein [unclassified Colwellia]MBA6257674.1 hypothetical protein [Colwellia sp. MB3u-28]MBA6259431.1 hypothetical protein [Colwellia sp. MB3u-41]MBA6304366.1 hypothetical protein [Colwellia sp. MB02u-14]
MTEDPELNFDVLNRLVNHLEHKIFQATEVDESNYYKNIDLVEKKLIHNAYCAWETALENQFVTDLNSGKAFCYQQYILNKRFERLLCRETSMLKGKNIKKALFIGSGPVPISAIWLNHYLQVPVDGIDICSKSIDFSTKLINQLDLSDQINLMHQPNGNYDVSEYDVIIIALLAKPKSLILDNIYKTMNENCEIICRTSFGLRHILYEATSVSLDLHDKFSIDDTRVVIGKGEDTISSLLLGKTDD